MWRSERLYKAFHEENAVQRFLCRKLFDVVQRLGVHITGNHFYEVIPDTRMVAGTYRDEPRALLGIELDIQTAEQVALRLIESYGREFYPAASARGYSERNPYFTGLDALLLYCWLRDTKPQKVVEVGQGFSTRVILAALERNGVESGLPAEFTSIDPYARHDQSVEIPGVRFARLLQPLESVDLATVFGDAGFVFIDSSHVFKFGSDVEFAFERLYPSLPAGMVVHVHDIFSPYHYPKDWIVTHKFFWNEQYHLENFLRFNPRFRVLLPVHYLSRHSQAVKSACGSVCVYPDYRHAGASFYIERVA
jgi:hypothetical protein